MPCILFRQQLWSWIFSCSLSCIFPCDSHAKAKLHVLDILRALPFYLSRTKQFCKSFGPFVTFGDKSRGMMFPLKGCMDYKVHGSFLYINLFLLFWETFVRIKPVLVLKFWIQHWAGRSHCFPFLFPFVCQILVCHVSFYSCKKC